MRTGALLEAGSLRRRGCWVRTELWASVRASESLEGTWVHACVYVYVYTYVCEGDRWRLTGL